MYSLFTSERWIFRPASGWLRIRRNEDLISLIVCVALLVVGAALIGRALEQCRRAQTMAAWPSTLGRVLSSGIEPVAASGELRWRPVVRYVYEVHGQVVISTGLSLDAPRETYSEAEARDLASPYTPNTTVPVFYNPDHVSEAIIDLSLPRVVWVSLLLGLVLLSAGTGRLLMSHRVFWR